MFPVYTYNFLCQVNYLSILTLFTHYIGGFYLSNDAENLPNRTSRLDFTKLYPIKLVMSREK